MKFVKILVILCCATIIRSNRSGYCEICNNHTLCKYPVGGPGIKCNGYDRGALLSDEDIVQIVNRINARRSLVATGRLKQLPQAANMRKVRWSVELASFAQRWADQCDPSVRPNKEDDCRNLVAMQVGQNIAAVLGPTSGLTVKSFVDMWFMLKLHYIGSVMYYNRSRDDRTNYFTQLIWAETEYVGCGKVKFFNQEMNTVVERLICNFSPKGNTHGKPVYALGYPATQCPNFMEPDHKFPGLCKQDHETATQIVQASSLNSLLRILDLSNNSAKHELDPNNLKQISFNSSAINDQRNQKTRHVYLNNSNGAIKRDSFHMQNPLNPLNDPENYNGNQFTPERGHSRMYHGHQTKNEPIQNFASTQKFTEDFRKYDLTTTAYSFPNHDYGLVPNARRLIINNQNGNEPSSRRFGDLNDFVPNRMPCTRKTQLDNCCSSHYLPNQYAREHCNSCLKPQPCISCLSPPPPPLLPLPPVVPSPNNACGPCKPPCCTEPSPCDPVMKCPGCPNHGWPSLPNPYCAKRRAEGGDAHDTSKTTQFNYYDLFPNIGMRSGDGDSQEKDFGHPEIKDNLENKARESELSNQVKDIEGHLQTGFQQPQDSYGIFYSSGRKRRDFEDQITFKPFWQMDEYNNKKPPELKSLRYTTLRSRKTRRTTPSARLPMESITIKLDDEIIHDTHHRVTEKYLSFEELMHLRKLSTLEGLDYEARRIGDGFLRKATTKKAAATTTKAATVKKTATVQAAAAKTTKKAAVTTTKTAVTTKAATTTKPTTTTKATTTAEMTTITANTPFIRLKQCTRKLTCTWTAMYATGADGKPILPGGEGGDAANILIDIGQRTPPGYVEGCTRTSTCTRDFMDRNKMATSTVDDSTDESTPEDEEYCEKRSLNVQRRNLEDTDKVLSIEFQDAITEMPPSSPEISHVTNRGITDVVVPQCNHGGCICYGDYSRVKRGEMSKYEQLLRSGCSRRKENTNIKSQDLHLYNSLMSKIARSSKFNKIPHQCPCNGTKSIHNTFYWVILLKYSLTWTRYVFMSNLKY